MKVRQATWLDASLIPDRVLATVTIGVLARKESRGARACVQHSQRAVQNRQLRSFMCTSSARCRDRSRIALEAVAGHEADDFPRSTMVQSRTRHNQLFAASQRAARFFASAAPDPSTTATLASARDPSSGLATDSGVPLTSKIKGLPPDVVHEVPTFGEVDTARKLGVDNEPGPVVVVDLVATQFTEPLVMFAVIQ
jgi:hypothetical protein